MLAATNGDPDLSASSWAASIEAEAQANLGHEDAYKRALEQAHQIFSLDTQHSPAWLRFDGGRLPALRGTRLVKLQRPTDAEPVLQEALLLAPAPTRRRAMILTDLALVSVQRQDADRACIDEVAGMIQLGSSQFLRSGLQQLQQQLKPYAHTVAGQQVASHMKQLA